MLTDKLWRTPSSQLLTVFPQDFILIFNHLRLQFISLWCKNTISPHLSWVARAEQTLKCTVMWASINCVMASQTEDKVIWVNDMLRPLYEYSLWFSSGTAALRLFIKKLQVCVFVSRMNDYAAGFLHSYSWVRAHRLRHVVTVTLSRWLTPYLHWERVKQRNIRSL